ncbi:Septum formation [Asanoa hainanensis]|uniref:Septum formation n=1 Tax=Asanoa hainanensis TaxID=560556 RepID=A0A239PG46_9ACTN|nr:septum formation family protein [Asanoa hainanensis]SNT66117.1 Septum formation [Asanoa hainanensis]
MRRWTAAVVALILSGAAVLSSAACGTNGDGGGGSVAAPAPAVTTPAPPRCHATVAARTADVLEGTVDCAASHQSETIHSGTFDDADAAKAPPASDVFGECDKQASATIGADWRTARLRLDVVLPTAAAWRAGQRWYRCDLVELTGVGPDGKVAARSGSLAGALTADSPLLLRCALVKLDKRSNVETVADSACDVKHEGEFAGVWTAPAKVPYPVKDRDYVPFYEGCLKTIAAYVDMPYDSGFATRTGYIPVMAAKDAWTLGDRGVRCFIWIRFRPLTASTKGVGEKGFPPNIARPS